ncbi:MAG: SIS domain-containing protein [Chloroflexi bacterium]|nr:SIS domain-containing protein [Chloroflexota bacterium]
MQSSSTFEEIVSQVDAWKDALHAVLDQRDPLQCLWQQNSYQQIVVTGCGSTYYLALAAASLLQSKTGRSSRAVPSSELLLNPESIYVANQRTLLIAISRSGATTETVQAAHHFVEQDRGDVIVISCYGDKPLNQSATISLVAPRGQEVSVAQTRSFSAMLVMAEQLASLLGGEPLSDDLFANVDQSYVESALRFAEQYIDPERFTRYFCLGGGPRYGLAAEAMLKMKEMSLTSAEPFHVMEFRHGPKSMIDNETVVIGLLSDTGGSAEMAVIDEMKALGATTITIGTRPDADFVPPNGARSLVYAMPVLQWLARQRAVVKGIDPDHPRNLEQVIRLPALHL